MMSREIFLTTFVVATMMLMRPAPTDCARILAMFPFPAKSHMVVFSALTRELARRGHELVVVSAHPLSKPMANYTDIDLMPSLKSRHEKMTGSQLYEMNDLKYHQMAFMMWNMGLDTSEVFLEQPEVQKLLQDKRGFDLVIIESFLNECIYGFAHHFKAPLVLISPFGGFHWVNYGTANPAPLSYVPNGMLDFTDHMTFMERTINLLFTSAWDIGHQLWYLPRQEEIMRRTFGADAPSVWELERSASLVLLNNHFSMNYPRPLNPNVIEVGGMHVMRTNNPLPKDIKDFLDGAKDGVVYFSMGSNLRGHQMPEERRRAFLDAFKELPQRVLWKWETDSLPGQPSNVKLGKWLPQQDILAHPNVRVFITHGGLLSAQEAAMHGVPLVGIPVFGDQSLNMKKAELGGFGVMVKLKNVTKESVLWAVKKALHDPSIKKEARRRSAVYRDQPETPLERAVFWTEYVLRHGGAPHLRSAALDLVWYQYFMLDVAAVLLSTLVLAYYILKFLLCRLCCGRNSSPPKTEKSTPSKTEKSKTKKRQ